MECKVAELLDRLFSTESRHLHWLHGWLKIFMLRLQRDNFSFDGSFVNFSYYGYHGYQHYGGYYM